MVSQIAVIGCGYWGKNLVRNFSELGALSAVCDAHTALSRDMAERYGVKALSLEEILRHPQIQGVAIAAPAVQHAALAQQALRAGKGVFVEKPLALKVEEAQKLCTLAEYENQVLMVGHLLQYHPAFLELQKIVRKGELGKLLYLYSHRLNLGKFRNEENILWSFAPHDISMILSLAQDIPETVYSTGSCYLNPRIYDVTTTHLNFKSGMSAHIFVSWLHPFKEQKLVVVADRGMAVFDDGLPWGEKLKVYPHPVTWVDGMPQPSKGEGVAIPLEVAEPLRMECQHFVDCIQKRSQPRTDGQEGLRVLKVLEAADQSLQSGIKVGVDSKTVPYFCHETALVDGGCEVGAGTKIWHFSHILKGTTIGEKCVIGQNVMIGPDVRVGNGCKIQNNVSLYKGVVLEEGVFCGPSCVFTNVLNPRSEVERKEEFRATYVERCVTIGANATIVCGVRLGAYSFVGAGAVVTKDVKPHALVVGNPAQQVGWMSHAGEKLSSDLVCPREGRQYALKENQLFEKKANHDLTQKSA